MGLGGRTIEVLISEVGPDFSRFRSGAAMASWAGLSPNREVSGGKVLRSKTRKIRNRVAHAFRMAANSLFRSASALGDAFPRLRARLGAPNMSKWPSAGHFVSWLGLCPDNDISGGKVLWRGSRGTKNRAGTLFRLAAHGLHRDQTPMGDYLRRMKAKLGPAAATTATAHKIAIVFYPMVKNQVECDVSLWAQRDAMRDKRIEARLQKQAAQRGYRDQTGRNLALGGERVTLKEVQAMEVGRMFSGV